MNRRTGAAATTKILGILTPECRGCTAFFVDAATLIETQAREIAELRAARL